VCSLHAARCLQLPVARQRCAKAGHVGGVAAQLRRPQSTGALRPCDTGKAFATHTQLTVGENVEGSVSDKVYVSTIGFGVSIHYHNVSIYNIVILIGKLRSPIFPTKLHRLLLLIRHMPFFLPAGLSCEPIPRACGAFPLVVFGIAWSRPPVFPPEGTQAGPCRDVQVCTVRVTVSRSWF